MGAIYLCLKGLGPGSHPVEAGALGGCAGLIWAKWITSGFRASATFSLIRWMGIDGPVE